MTRGYSSRYWGTYAQWNALGAQVRKRPADIEPGQCGTSVIFYRQIKKTKIENGEEKTDTFPVLRTFTVFNIDQVDGESVDHLRASTDLIPVPSEPDYGSAREAIAATGADIRFGGDRAFYARPIGEFPNHDGGDYIQMPHPGQFVAPNEFVSTNFHELVHWSEVRLGWKGSYAMGELIAEIGACYSRAQRASRAATTSKSHGVSRRLVEGTRKRPESHHAGCKPSIQSNGIRSWIQPQDRTATRRTSSGLMAHSRSRWFMPAAFQNASSLVVHRLGAATPETTFLPGPCKHWSVLVYRKRKVKWHPQP